MRRSSGHLGRRLVGQEVGDHLHRPREAERAMFVPAEFALGDEGVDVAQLAFQHVGVAPRLGRTAIADGAAQAMLLVAKLTIVPPEHVRGADQPMLVRLIDRDAPPVGQQAWSADQRDIVEPGHVESALVHELLDPRAMHYRPAELMGQQIGGHTHAAAQPDDLDPLDWLDRLWL